MMLIVAADAVAVLVAIVGDMIITPSGLGFGPESTHCGDLDTSATGGQNYDDGYDQGYVDAHRDFRGLNGHGFDDSVNHGSAVFKSGYVKGEVMDGIMRRKEYKIPNVIY